MAAENRAQEIVAAVDIGMVICIAGDRAAKKPEKAFWGTCGCFEGFRGRVGTERAKRCVGELPS
ncbi:hypothetical protein ACFYW9_06240 [Streptomyces sp. NPDC002698]|uniref:hypothetical protein n=1 Tax=Streptomyces sp. NPDC002698 TaxID=3364660 RepID=UPI0036C4B9E7